MARGKDYTNFIVTEKEKICDLIDGISSSMSDYINQNQDSEFVILYKYISHSDLATFGKATKVDMLEKNILYYLSYYNIFLCFCILFNIYLKEKTHS